MATIPGVSDNELIRTTWGDAVADELNNNIVKKTGGHFTGAVAGIAPTAAEHFTRKDYVDTQVATSVATTGDTMSGNLNLGNVASASNDGVSVRTDGLIQSSVVVGGGAPNSLPNIVVGRTSSPAQDAGGVYVRFERTSSGTDIGSITVASASAVAYNTTSDPRLKQPTGDVADAADIAQQLGAKAYRGRWIADQGDGEEWVFLNSTDVEAVAPYAVHGDADATGPGGEIIPQQLDHSALVPLLFAALAQALDRIAALEAG